MHAFGTVRDPVAWILRGWVEGQVPELPAGSGEPGAWGAWETDITGRVAFRVRAAEWDDERAYAVHRVVDAAGRAEVLVLCADSLFRHGFPELPLETLGARILAHVRHHDAAFAAWRAQGGELSPAERASVGDARGALPPDPGLVAFLGWLRGQRLTLAHGPQAGWWAGPSAVTQAWGGIRAGAGVDRAYQLRPAEADLPHNRAYAGDVQRVGRILQVVGIVTVLLAIAGSGYLGLWSLRALRVGMATRPILTTAGLLGFVQGGVQALAGTWMRALRRRAWLPALALVGGVPWSVAGLLTFPAGVYAWWVLRDPRADVVLSRD
ncbi:MAG: hypothetical protein RLZZ299_31 [Pseudomonadota bacterium]|jgi:hypothetical protein